MSATTLNGTTGAPLGSEPLITVDDSDESVLQTLARALEVEAEKRTVLNTAKNDHAAAKKRAEAAAQHAAAYYARTRQVEMQLTVGGTDPGDE